MNSKSTAGRIAQLTLDKKADNVIVMDLKNIASFTDYFVICSADSDTQVKAIADYVIEEMKKDGVEVWHAEGYEALSWIILDFVDVVAHVFHKNTRSFYNLEKMWGDAKIKKFEDKLKSTPEKKTTRKKNNAKIS